MKNSISRRKMVASLGGFAMAAVGIEGLILEPRRVQVSRHAVGEPKDVGGPTVGILQLTDLHLRSMGAYQENIARTVADLGPDLIVFTGDSVDRPRYIPPFREFLGTLDARIPKYAVLGNWEHKGGLDLRQLESVYQAANCRLLVNESVLHEAQGAQLRITGLDDLVAGKPENDIARLSGPGAGNHLVLAHCPGHRDRLELGDAPPQYMLSGHTHGGQVALLGFAPLRPRGSGRYHSGWYRGSRPELYVSRGLGWSDLPIRIGAPPEIAFFEWTLS